ncbi:uncharacterized protein LOC129842944 [Salvelinus fontinalis]|uniref:uncharacterized protein LOC129842944 n=1 Tax=Salvelinus fontinalis TaxID=8038 RepID=UPI00248691BB|nr:uncharacterized protein LOC129842944 [Salvelinus fontinalis]
MGMEDQESELPMDPEICFDPLFIDEKDKYGNDVVEEETGASFQPLLGVTSTNTLLTGSAHSQCSLSDTYRETHLDETQAQLKNTDTMFRSCVGETTDSFGSHLSTTAHTNTHLSGLGQNQPHLSGLGQNQPPLSGLGQIQPHLSGLEQNQPPLSGLEQNQPHLSWLEQNQPPLSGLGQIQPHLSGLGQNQPPLSGLEQNQPHLSGLGQNQPHLSGLGQNQPHLSGLGQIQQHLSGLGQIQPHLSGLGQIQPHLSGLGQNQPHLSGLGQNQPPLSGLEQNQPHLSVLGQSQPPLSGLGQNQPHLSGLEQNQPHLSGLRQIQPHLSGLGQIQPPLSGLGQIQQHLSGLEQNQPPLSGLEQIQQHLSGLGQIQQHLAGLGQIQPHLREMDDLLKSCEDMTGVSIASCLSTRYTDTHLSGPAQNQNQSDIQKMVAMIGSCGGNDCHTGGSILTYTDTHMEESRNQCQSHLKEVESILDQSGATGAAVQPQLPPLTSAGTQLSGTMAEYQTELMAMLAMLENCMEEAGITFDPLEWTYPSLPKGYGQPNPDMNKVTQDRHMERGGATQGHMESLGCVDLKPYLGSTFGQFEPPSYQAISTERHSDELGDCGDTHTRGSVSTVCDEDTEGHVSGVSVGDTEAHIMWGQQLETGLGGVEMRGSMQELEGLGTVLEGCIEEVEKLEKRRDELMGELQALREEKTGTEEGSEGGQAAQLNQVLNIEADGRREARMREWQSLRAERSVEERRLSSVRLERQGLQEEMRRLKRRLFSVARECAHNQVILATQQRDVAQLNKEQMELDALIIKLTEEVSQLRSTHQSQLSTLQSQLQTRSQTPKPIEEMTQSKRNSCGDIQQYLQGGLRALEERYEPMLLALLKRREGTSEALVKARQQAQELRARRGPLREEGQRLGLQRACLEERLKLMETHRREDVEQYRETVDRLEETSREQKMELQIQKRKTKEMEELRDSLTKELYLYRGIAEDSNKNDLASGKEET